MWSAMNSKTNSLKPKPGVSSAIAKPQPLCLTHNFMIFMVDHIRKRCCVINQAEFKRRGQTRTDNAYFPPKSTSPENRAIHSMIERLTQRTVKFIRLLKNRLNLERDWDRAIARLGRIYAHL